MSLKLNFNFFSFPTAHGSTVKLQLMHEKLHPSRDETLGSVKVKIKRAFDSSLGIL